MRRGDWPALALAALMIGAIGMLVFLAFTWLVVAAFG